MAHLRRVHGYDSVKRIEPISVDGPRLDSRFDFRTTRKIARIATLTLDFSTSTRVFGLGYSFVEFQECSIGMDMRLWVLATPIDGVLIDLSLVSQVKEIRNPETMDCRPEVSPAEDARANHEQIHGFSAT